MSRIKAVLGLAMRCASGSTLGAAMLLANAGQAQSNYPNRPIRVIVPYAAGGIVDIVARAVTEQVGRDWKHAVIIETRPGGNSNIGTTAVARSEPDGYTWLVTGPAALVNPTLYKDAGWDALKDLRCVGLAVWGQSVALVHPSMPAGTIREFVEIARKKPGELNFGNPGTGSSIDLSAQKLFQVADIKLTNVSYKGQPQALIDLLTNLMHFEIVSLELALQHIKAGSVKPLAVMTDKRVADLPGRPDDCGSRLSRGRLRALVRRLCSGGNARFHRREDQRWHQQGDTEPGRAAPACDCQYSGQADAARGSGRADEGGS
jgi:tripartite-type tricarboxylate transporter receptor subunit TctC